MDNDLDSRLRRLEALLTRQQDLLEVQADRQAQTYEVVCALRMLMAQPEPEGPPLHELLAQLIAVVTRSTMAAEQTLAAIEALQRRS